MKGFMVNLMSYNVEKFEFSEDQHVVMAQLKEKIKRKQNEMV